MFYTFARIFNIQHPTFYDRMLFRTIIERSGCIFLFFVLVLSILAFKTASASSESEHNDTEFQAFVGKKNLKREKKENKTGEITLLPPSLVLWV